MKKFLDVNLQRRIKKKANRKKLTKKYFKIFLFFFSFFAIMFVVWQISFKKVIFGNKNENFPILFSGDVVLGFEKTKKGFCVLTNSHLNFYKKDGGLLRETISNSLKSQIKACSKKVLLYEKGSKNFVVQNERRVVLDDVLEDNILFGKIFRNGNFAFVTKGENYFCNLVVFNKNDEQIFKWSCAESLILDFDLFDDDSGCVLCVAGVKDGFLKSSVFELKFSSKGERLKKDFGKYMPLEIKKAGAIIVLVCDSRVFFIDSKGNELKSVEYGKNLINYTLTENGYFIGCFSNLDRSDYKNSVISYDKFGNKISEYKTNENINKIKSYFNDIIILTEKDAIHMNINLKEISRFKNAGNFEEMIYDKPYLYFVSMNKVNRILLK